MDGQAIAARALGGGAPGLLATDPDPARPAETIRPARDDRAAEAAREIAARAMLP